MHKLTPKVSFRDSAQPFWMWICRGYQCSVPDFKCVHFVLIRSSLLLDDASWVQCITPHINKRVSFHSRPHRTTTQLPHFGDFSLSKYSWLLLNPLKCKSDTAFLWLLISDIGLLQFKGWNPPSPPDPQGDASNRCVSQHPPTSAGCYH